MMRPIGDRLLVEVIDDNETQTEAGIHLLPDSVGQSSLLKGKVLAVGDGEAVQKSIKVNDIVIFPRGAGMRVEGNAVGVLKGREHGILPFKVIMAVE